MMGRDDLIGDPRYANPEARTERREEVDEIVAEWTRKDDKHEAMRLVSLATIRAAAVLDTAERAADQTFQDRSIRQTMKHPTAGDYVMSGWRCASAAKRLLSRRRCCSASAARKCSPNGCT